MTKTSKKSAARKTRGNAPAKKRRKEHTPPAPPAPDASERTTPGTSHSENNDMQSTLNPPTTTTRPTVQEPPVDVPVTIDNAKPKVLTLPDNHVIALTPDGSLRVMGFIVGASFEADQWGREEVVAKAIAAGLPPQAITGGRLSTLNEFQRAVQALVEDPKLHGPQPLEVRTPGGLVAVNAHIAVEVKSVDSTARGACYQLNRRVKYFVKDIEKTLVAGITKDDIMAALDAKGDTDHVITQNIGKWTLQKNSTAEDEDDRFEIVADLLPKYKENDPTGVAKLFSLLTERLRENFADMSGYYSETDIKNAWNRTRGAMTASFPFDFGAGGITYVPVKYKPHLDAWRTFLTSLYGSDQMGVLPVANLEDAQKLVQDRAGAWLAKEKERVILDLIESVEVATQQKAGEKLDKALEGIEETLAARLKRLTETETQINATLEDRFRVHAHIAPSRMVELTRTYSDPRLKSIFHRHGLIEEDDAPTQRQVTETASHGATVDQVATSEDDTETFDRVEEE